MSEAAAEGLETEINKDHDQRRVRVALWDPILWVLTGVACVLAIWGTHLAVGDPRGEHYFFPVREDSPLGLMTAGVGLVGFGVAGIAGIIVWVFAVLLMLALAVPIFIIVGKENASTSEVGKAFKRCLLVFSEPGYYWGDMMWVLGILLVPGVLALVMIIKLFQKDTSGNR